MARPRNVDNTADLGESGKIMSQWPGGGRRDGGRITHGIIAVGGWRPVGIDLREGLTSGPLLGQARQTLREAGGAYTQDRF